MVFVKCFFSHCRRHRSSRIHGHRPHRLPRLHARLDLVNVARHELDAGTLEDFSGPVVDSHPAHNIDHVAFFRRNDVVIRLPAHPAGDVRKLCGNFARLIGCNQPLQPRFQNGLCREIGENGRAWKTEAQLASDLNNRLFSHTIVLPIAIGIEIIRTHVAAANHFTFNGAVIG